MRTIRGRSGRLYAALQSDMGYQWPSARRVAATFIDKGVDEKKKVEIEDALGCRVAPTGGGLRHVRGKVYMQEDGNDQHRVKTPVPLAQ